MIAIANGYRLILIDSRGHGRSTRDERPYTYELMASDVLAVMESLHLAQAALDLQNRIGHAAALVTTKYGVPGLKYAMDLAGYYGGPPRLPLTVPTPAAKKEIEAAFADLRG